MTGAGVWLSGAGVLLIGGTGPALVLALRGEARYRLVGLQFVGGALTIVLVVLALGLRRPDYLIVPLTLALLGYAGVLVFARLIGDSDE